MKIRLNAELPSEDLPKSVQAWVKRDFTYEVIEMNIYEQQTLYRIYSKENRTPFLVDSCFFSIEDASLDPSWIVQRNSKSWSLAQRSFANNSFWEDYFDGEPYAVQSFKQYLCDGDAR